MFLLHKWTGVVQLEKISRGIVGLSNLNMTAFSANPKPDIEPNSTKIMNRKRTREEIKRLSSVLDLSKDTIKLLVKKKPRLITLSNEQLLSYVKVLKKYNISKGLVDCPHLISVQPTSLENYILIFKETGMEYRVVQRLIRFRQLKNTYIKALKEQEVICPTSDVVENYIAALKLKNDLVPGLYDYLATDPDEFTLSGLRRSVLSYYLTTTLGIDMKRTVYVLSKTYKCDRISNRSFAWITEIIRILKETFHFSNDLIQRHHFLFAAIPENLIEISKIPTLAGIPTVKQVQTRPKILMCNADTILKIDAQMQEQNFTPQQLSISAGLYTLSSEAVRLRLEALNTIPELVALRTHPRAMCLLYNQTVTKKRLKIISDLNLPGPLPGLSVLSGPHKLFDRILDRSYRPKGHDTLMYLHQFFLDQGKTLEDVRQKLIIQKYWVSIDITSVHEVVEFLVNFENKAISKSVIFASLPIVLYPKAKIETAIEEVLDAREAQPTDPYFLHMVLYFIEKLYHFSGDGVWTQLPVSNTPAVSADSQDFLLNLDTEEYDVDEQDIMAIESVDEFEVLDHQARINLKQTMKRSGRRRTVNDFDDDEFNDPESLDSEILAEEFEEDIDIDADADDNEESDDHLPTSQQMLDLKTNFSNKTDTAKRKK